MLVTQPPLLLHADDIDFVQNCDMGTVLYSSNVFGTNDPDETLDDDGRSF